MAPLKQNNEGINTMNKYDAAKVLNITEITKENVKLAYRKACSKYHPDRNAGGLEMMKAVNEAYEALKDLEDQEIEQGSENYGGELMNVINALSDFDLELELCGSWLWIHGNTKEVKEVLKANKCRWAPKKQAWYFRPEGFKSFNRGKFSMDDIRAHHGSQKVKGQGRAKISA